MRNFFDQALEAVNESPFEETPVDIQEFVESEKFLSAKKRMRLSKIQYDLVRAMSQIYYLPELIELHGEQEALRRWKQTAREVIMQLGKGSGKDFTSTIAVSYVVYLCLCLKSPTEYFQSDTIDIINVAINADQAQRVFFANLVKRIKENPWFEGKYDDGRDNIKFDKEVYVYSGHSERESYEGYNTLIIILDEISGFALESTSGNQKAKTGEAIYDWARGSVTSRFSETGKVVMLSFPRFKDDFIQQKYDEVVSEKETITRTATLLVDPTLSADYPGNSFDIEWEEDHIVRYNFPYTFALKRPSWEVNPNKELQKDYALDFYRNPGDAYGRFACMPSNLEDGYFKNMDKVREAFILKNGVDEHGVFMDDFVPDPNKNYYVHVDLAQKHDHAAVAMAHVEKWVKVGIGADDAAYKVEHPITKVDVIRYWTPTKSKTIEFDDIRDFIVALRDRGFKIKLCTFDRWNSHETMNILWREHGIKTELLSVALKHYDDFLSSVYGTRLVGPQVDLLIKELGELQLIKNKVDHPAKGSKDLSDAVCGAIFNAISLTPKPVSTEVEVMSLADLIRSQHEEEQERLRLLAPNGKANGPITSPRRKIPDDIQQFLSEVRIL